MCVENVSDVHDHALGQINVITVEKLPVAIHMVHNEQDRAFARDDCPSGISRS
jgi:hypothetical protein